MVILISICCVECVHIASESVVVHHIMPFLKIDTMRTLDCALVGLDIALAEDSKEVNKIRTHEKRALSLSLFVFNSLRNEDFVLVFVYMCRVLSFLYLLQFIKVCVGMVARGIINKHKRESDRIFHEFRFRQTDKDSSRKSDASLRSHHNDLHLPIHY